MAPIPGHTLCGERTYKDTLTANIREVTCYYCKLAWDKRFNKSASLNLTKESILRRALLNDIITPDEASSSDWKRAAQTVAEEWNDSWPEGEGFGSSDMTAVIRDVLATMGVNVDYVGGRLRRTAGITKVDAQAYDLIGPGALVTIVNRFDQTSKGRAVMLGPAGWVLNMGGRHGTPAIATPSNVVSVKRK